MLLEFKISEGKAGVPVYSDKTEAMAILTGEFLFPTWHDRTYFYPGDELISLN